MPDVSPRPRRCWPRRWSGSRTIWRRAPTTPGCPRSPAIGRRRCAVGTRCGNATRKNRSALPPGAIALRELRRFDEADALLADAIARLPDRRAPLIEHAWLASARRDWPEAARRWALVRERFPDAGEAYLRGAQAASASWQHAEAEALLAAAMDRFP